MFRLPPLHAVAAIVATAASSLLAAPTGGPVAVPVGQITSRDAPTAVVARAASVSPDRRFPLDGPAIAAARRVATAYWGAEPCGGDVRVAWTAMPPGTNAVASWRNPTDAWNAPSANFDCRIELNAQGQFDFPKLCTVLTHEVGHLLGRPHAHEPGQLMSVYYERPIQPCVDADPARAAQPQQAPAAAAPARTATAAATRRRGGAGRGARSAARRTTLSRTGAARKAARTGRRCVVRLAHGRHVRRCAPLRRTHGTIARTSRRCVVWLAHGRRVERCTAVRAAQSRARAGRARR